MAAKQSLETEKEDKTIRKRKIESDRVTEEKGQIGKIKRGKKREGFSKGQP